MSAARTMLLGLLLGALSASLLQGCDEGCGEYPCPRPTLRPFRAGLYWPPATPGVAAPGAESDLTLTVDEARTHATERYERGGHVVETEYEVVRIDPVPVWR